MKEITWVLSTSLFIIIVIYYYYILSVLGIKPRTLCMLSKSSTTELAHSPWFFIYHLSSGWPGTHVVAQVDLMLIVLLSWPVGCLGCSSDFNWNCSHEHGWLIIYRGKGNYSVATPLKKRTPHSSASVYCKRPWMTLFTHVETLSGFLG